MRRSGLIHQGPTTTATSEAMTIATRAGVETGI